METNKHGIGWIAYDRKCGILTKISKYKSENSLLLAEINFLIETALEMTLQLMRILVECWLPQ